MSTTIQEVPMKLAIVRSGEVVEMRRRRLVNPSYEVVAKVAAEFARGKYRLQYTDEDGDVVTMSTQDEWEECLASWDCAHALKIRVELCGGKGWCRGRSRSSSRSSSPACRRTKKGCRSVSPSRRSRSPRHHVHPWMAAHEHFPFRFHAWLAKKAAQANAANADRDVQPKVGEKCANFDHQTTGLVAGFCCKKCMRGKGNHGKRREQKPCAAATSDTDDNKCPEASSSSDEHCEKTATHDVQHVFAGNGWRGHGCGRHGHFKGQKGMHGHGKGCKGMPHGHHCKREVNGELTGQKCTNCDFATTGIVDQFCCMACMHGRGHGLWCKQQPFEGSAKPEAEQDGAMEPTNVAEQQEAAPASRQRGWWGWKKAANPALIGQKCTNCDFKTTGVVDAFCCRRCMHGKGHGRRCEQQPYGDATQEGHAAEATPCSSEEQRHEARPVEGRPCHMRCRSRERRVDPESVGQKCTNCDFKTTGVVDRFCCRRCMHGKGHGARCQQVPLERADEPQLVDTVTSVPVEGEPCVATTAEVLEVEPTPQPYASQIAQLEEMGFTVNAQVINALAAADGNIATVLTTLFL